MAHAHNMKKIFQFLLILAFLSGFGISAAPAVAAPSAEEAQLTLAELGLESDMLLHGPYDTTNIRFDLPATWKLQPGAELTIDVGSAVTGDESILQSAFSGATLEVYVNDRFQQSIPLASNETKTYTIPIDPADLVSPNPGGWHELSFYLYSEFDCTIDFHQTTVTIDADSVASFPHEPTSLALDLRRLPWPIYLQHSKLLDPVSVVIPSSPTADEIQSALVVMGSFGRMTRGNLPVTMITADQLSDTQRKESHLVLVGKTSALSAFSNLSFPVPLVSGQFAAPELKKDDGVLQLLASPWNSTKSILVVSGNTDPGVVKAAQALSTLNLQTGDTPDYSIVSQVFPAPPAGLSDGDSAAASTADIKLSDLGYTSVTATGMGTNWLDYQFTIPLGLIPKETPYMDLALSASTLVDPKRSEGIVYLNGVQIGSVPLSTEDSNLITTRINFPPSVLRAGINNLSLVFNLLPYDECTVFAFDSLWITVYADSLIHLSLMPSPVSSFALQDLKNYPYPFAMDPSLSTTAFILAKQDPFSWLQASRIAYDLGARISGSVLGFETAFDGEIPEEMRTMNLIVVGEPKNLGVVADLKDALPAYFENGSNIAVLDSQQVIYRISDKKSLGYLELFQSPWSDERAVSGIFGTTPAGIASAVDALINVQSRDTFAGDFVTMDGTNAHIVDTRTGAGMGDIVNSLDPSVSQNENVETTPVSVSNTQIAYARSKQVVLMAAIFVVVLIVVTIASALWFRRQRQ